MVKIKGKFVPLSKCHAIETYWGRGTWLHAFLTSSLYGVECSTSFTFRPLYPLVKNLGSHWTGGCVGPGAGLDVVARR